MKENVADRPKARSNGRSGEEWPRHQSSQAQEAPRRAKPSQDAGNQEMNADEKQAAPSRRRATRGNPPASGTDHPVNSLPQKVCVTVVSRVLVDHVQHHEP
jgi:hypothetical protein